MENTGNLKRILVTSGKLWAYGHYSDPDCKCTWNWNKETKEIHDITDSDVVCVGYADNLDNVLNS